MHNINCKVQTLVDHSQAKENVHNPGLPIKEWQAIQKELVNARSGFATAVSRGTGVVKALSRLLQAIHLRGNSVNQFMHEKTHQQLNKIETKIDQLPTRTEMAVIVKDAVRELVSTQSSSTAEETRQKKAAEKEAEAARKKAEKEAEAASNAARKKAEQEAEAARKKAEKEAEAATKKAKQEAEAASKATMKKAEQEAEAARQKAEKEAEATKKKAEKEAEVARKKAEKEEEAAKKKAEKEAADAVKEAKKNEEKRQAEQKAWFAKRIRELTPRDDGTRWEYLRDFRHQLREWIAEPWRSEMDQLSVQAAYDAVVTLQDEVRLEARMKEERNDTEKMLLRKAWQDQQAAKKAEEEAAKKAEEEAALKAAIETPVNEEEAKQEAALKAAIETPVKEEAEQEAAEATKKAAEEDSRGRKRRVPHAMGSRVVE